jgi:hypothetical protein
LIAKPKTHLWLQHIQGLDVGPPLSIKQLRVVVAVLRGHLQDSRVEQG